MTITPHTHSPEGGTRHEDARTLSVVVAVATTLALTID